jgi:WD40 repeat protein
VASPVSPSELVEGLLSNDRVPFRIVWQHPGTTITALMRDPESVPPQSRQANELRQWDVATGKLRWSEFVAGAGSVAGTADGKFLAIVIGNEVQLRDAASGKIVRKWATEQPLSPLAFSPDGKTLTAGITQWGQVGGNGGKKSGGVQFWNVERASLVRFISDDKPTTFVAYSSDGKSLATSSNEGPMKLWNAATGELTRIFPGCFRAAFSPNGETIGEKIAFVSAAPSANDTIGRVDLYNLSDGLLVKSFASQKGASASTLLCLAFSLDSRLLAASDWNGTVTLWDVATGQRKETSAGHKAGVHTVVFAPDGIATGSEDKTLRLWKFPAEMKRRPDKK